MADTLEQILSQSEENEVVQYAKKVQQQNAEANSTETAPTEYVPGQFYKEFEKQYAGYKPLTAEQQQEADRRERTNKTIAGISDMLSALSNLYFTTKGAPNDYDPKNSLSGKMMERYDQLRKERETRDKEYNTGLQRARQLDQQYDLSWNQLKEQRERWKAQDERNRQLDAERKAQKEAELEIKRQAEEEKRRHNEEMEKASLIRANKPTGRGGRGRQGTSGKTTNVYDKNGRLLKTTTVQNGVVTPTRTGSTIPSLLKGL